MSACKGVMKAPKGCNAFDREPHLHGKGNKNEVGYTRDGWLNQYSLMCGYQELIEHKHGRVRLWAEGDCYHVLAFNNDSECRDEWFTETDIGLARAKFVEWSNRYEFTMSSSKAL